MEQPRTTKRQVKVIMTRDERLAMGEDLALEHRRLEEVQERKAQVNAAIKAELETHQSRINHLSQTLRNGYEYRDVTCLITSEFGSNQVMVSRIDTGEIIEQRAMTAEERQRELELKPPDEPKADAASKDGARKGPRP